MSKGWYLNKTNRLAIAGIVTAFGGYFTDELSLVGLIGTVFVAVGSIFMRQGIAKSGPELLKGK